MSNGKKTVARPAKKAALGRGLGSLLGGFSEEPAEANAAVATPPPGPVVEKPSKNIEVKSTDGIDKLNQVVPKIPPEARIWQIDIDKIQANKEQPRKHFEKEALQSLAASIKEKGILQPITVRKLDNQMFEIIAGERRWRAAQLAGLHRVPVILKNADMQTSLEWALIENIQRKDLNVIEEAEAYRHLMDEYGLTQQELADRVGKERASVANILRLLNLSTEVRQMVINEEISLGQAKLLLSLQDPKTQLKVAQKIKNDRLTVRATEKLITKWNETEDLTLDETAAKEAGPIKSLTQELEKMLGTKVLIDYSKGKGKVSIHFYSDDELNGFVDQIRRIWQK